MQTPQKTIIKISLLAALGYGSWAVFVNYDYGMMTWMKAGLAQGSTSFMMTFFLTNLAYMSCHKAGYGKKGIGTGYLASIIAMVVIPYTAHSIAGTPRIWASMAPGLIWGSVYIIGYLVTLNKKYRTNSE